MNKVQTTKKDFSISHRDLLNKALTEKGYISKCYHVFHNFSINNQWIASWQLASKGYDLSPIATFNKWKSLGRSINKGEKAIYLWMPIGSTTYTVKDDETGEEKTVHIASRFKYINRWFSLDQTNGKDLKSADDFAELKIGDFDFSKLYKAYNIKMIKYDSLNGNAQGYVNIKNEIALNPLAQHAEKTILHEICHVALEHTDKRHDLDRDLKEVEAETTCFIVGTILGFNEDDLSSSRAYIQGWLGGNDLPEANIKKILATANKILNIGLGKNDKDNKGE